MCGALIVQPPPLELAAGRQRPELSQVDPGAQSTLVLQLLAQAPNAFSQA